MKKILTLLALTLSFSINAQMDDNSSNTSATGASSVAMGSGTTASGDSATAMGISTIASGPISTAIGNQTEASGQSSLAGGEFSTASAINSIAIGSVTVASGIESTAFGKNTTASGARATALGQFTLASGNASTATGANSIASGVFSTAIGYGAEDEYVPGESTPFYRNEALGNYSVVLGNRNKSIDVGSVSIGSDNLSYGRKSLAIGENNISTGQFSMAMGLFSESVGDKSFAFGNNAYAGGFNTVAVGSANTIDENASANEWSVNNRLFVVGNGQYNEETETLERSDAFTIMFNGDATLAGNLSVNSDARLKSNIISLGSTMSKLLEIDGKSYIMKRDEKKEPKIGLLAQDIEKVFPELVSEINGIKSVNYQGLVPVLINALKEQDVKMKEQQMEIESLRDQEKRIDRLEKLITQLD
jgi:hypothetical protein